MLRRLVVPILAAVTLTLGAPLSAQAATLNLVDARGDVHRMTDDGGFERAVGERRADILRTRITHTDRTLVVRTKLRDLRREGNSIGMAMRMRTNDGTYREVALEAGRRIGWRGQVSMNTRRGATVDCAASHQINYATDTLAVRIPRSCLNDPRWVQATLVSVFYGGRHLLADNPHNERMRLNVWTSRIRRG
jgi:hypothetical protein